jgi:hypothetical protein
MTLGSLEIGVFAVGAALMAFMCVRIWKGANAPQITAMLFFPCALMLSAMLSSRISTLKFGPGGVEFNLEELKAAASAAVTENPDVAKAVANDEGPGAVEKAKDLIEKAETKEDLSKLIPFRQEQNTVYFLPGGQKNKWVIPAHQAQGTIAVLNPIKIDTTGR